MRYHTYAEYAKLSIKQKAELHEWRKNNKETGKGKSDDKDEKDKKKVTFADQKKFKKMVSEVVAAKLTSLDDKKKKEETVKEDAAMGDCLLSLVQAALSKADSAFE